MGKCSWEGHYLEEQRKVQLLNFTALEQPTKENERQRCKDNLAQQLGWELSRSSCIMFSNKSSTELGCRHSIIAWLGLERTLKIIYFQTRDTSP